MNNPTVSIIVPVYKTEKYLRKCLESLVKQTLADIEIIVVNDGSPDNSQIIIDEFVKQYPSKLFSNIKNNGGLGDACNYGVQRAQGEYIGFIASDDYVKQDMFEKMYQKAKSEQADMVICEFEFVDEAGTVLVQTDITGHNDLPKNDRRYALKYGRTEAFNKIYRKELFTGTGIRYPAGWFEDYPTTPLLIEAAKKIVYVAQPLMYYVERQGSIMNQAYGTFSKKNFDILTATDSIVKNRVKFNPVDYEFFIDEIIPVHAFLKYYYQIITIPDYRYRSRVIREWGFTLNTILPGWDKSKAIAGNYRRLDSFIKKILFRLIIYSFKTGNTRAINFLMLFWNLLGFV